jgi:CRISPR/Cas system CSM-associated protein Csm3 (group 7 of RAMP superfamily)
MARRLLQRLRIEGKLCADSPIHIGGAGDDLALDMPLARSGDGRCHIPGASLTGAIRNWWRHHFPEPEVNALFGYNECTGNLDHGSYILIEDAFLEGADNAEIRDGVGIDRHSGTAAAGIKYDREILPSGAKFCFRCMVEMPAMKPPGWPKELEPNLAALVEALRHGRIRFGAAKSRGHGKLKLIGETIFVFDVGTRAGILNALAGRPVPLDQEKWLRGATKVSSETVCIRIKWSPELPVMCRAGVDGFLADTLPLVTADGEGLRAVITGSGIKGALRS